MPTIQTQQDSHHFAGLSGPGVSFSKSLLLLDTIEYERETVTHNRRMTLAAPNP